MDCSPPGSSVSPQNYSNSQWCSFAGGRRHPQSCHCRAMAHAGIPAPECSPWVLPRTPLDSPGLPWSAAWGLCWTPLECCLGLRWTPLDSPGVLPRTPLDSPGLPWSAALDSAGLPWSAASDSAGLHWTPLECCLRLCWTPLESYIGRHCIAVFTSPEAVGKYNKIFFCQSYMLII